MSFFRHWQELKIGVDENSWFWDFQPFRTILDTHPYATTRIDMTMMDSYSDEQMTYLDNIGSGAPISVDVGCSCTAWVRCTLRVLARTNPINKRSCLLHPGIYPMRIFFLPISELRDATSNSIEITWYAYLFLWEVSNPSDRRNFQQKSPFSVRFSRFLSFVIGSFWSRYLRVTPCFAASWRNRPLIIPLSSCFMVNTVDIYFR